MMYMSRKRDEWMKRGVCMDKTTERANEGGKERQESKKTIDQSNEKNSKHSIFFSNNNLKRARACDESRVVRLSHTGSSLLQRALDT